MALWATWAKTFLLELYGQNINWVDYKMMWHKSKNLSQRHRPIESMGQNIRCRGVQISAGSRWSPQNYWNFICLGSGPTILYIYSYSDGPFISKAVISRTFHYWKCIWNPVQKCVTERWGQNKKIVCFPSPDRLSETASSQKFLFQFFSNIFFLFSEKNGVSFP